MKPLIYIVDDEPAIVRIIKINLELKGYTVRSASDGVEALNALQNEPEPIALLIADVMMPYMDGFELLARLKSDPKLKTTPVVMLTARSVDADIEEGYKRGAVGYLTKPIQLQELMDTVQMVAGKPE
jgi:twitching motility two-component system response regulator PilH